MSHNMICDGCYKELKENSSDHAITGERADKMGGGGLPNGRFDWCFGCAKVAFAALKIALPDRTK